MSIRIPSVRPLCKTDHALALSRSRPSPSGFIEPCLPTLGHTCLDPLVVDDPARLAQQSGDLAITVATILSGKLDNIGRQPLLVFTTARDLALRRAVLPERRTGAALGDMQLRSDLPNAGTATRGA